MAIKMVREPSDTPNIANIDDFVSLRYAYGNQNGYVIGKGNECSHTILGSTFKIESGRLVLQGVECDIDANGVSIAVDNVSTKRYFTVYLQVNLILNEAKILSTFDTADYPSVSSGEDLTNNTTGIARLELYHFTAVNAVISNVAKLVQKIDYIGTWTKVDNAKNAEKVNSVKIEKSNTVLLCDNSYRIPLHKVLLSTPKQYSSQGAVICSVENGKQALLEVTCSLDGGTDPTVLVVRFRNRGFIFTPDGGYMYFQVNSSNNLVWGALAGGDAPTVYRVDEIIV